MTEGVDEVPSLDNPYSPMAVAQVTEFYTSDSEYPTIATDAVRKALAHLSACLSTGSVSSRDGKGTALAVIGDYGTGKSHLALRLVQEAGVLLGDHHQAMYLEATASTFVDLYRRFAQRLDRDFVRTRVSDFYIDVVTSSLQDTGLSGTVLEWLQNRELNPQQVVERLGLMESSLLRRVHEDLAKVTRDEAFGTALTLLLRSGFEDAVWDWFSGAAPAEVLRERGIVAAIDTEATALAAMGVFALLFGSHHGRFVLVLDEMDKIFTARRREDQNVQAAFQNLLEIFSRAGACLVLVGLPDFLRVLHARVRERIPHTVELHPLEADEVRQFIELAQNGRLAPFTAQSPRSVRDLSGGKARDVIRLLRAAYALWADAARMSGVRTAPVSETMIRDAAHHQFGSRPGDDVEATVIGVLKAHGWQFRLRHRLGPPGSDPVDFWVTFPGRAGGCAILVTRSILDDGDVKTLNRKLADLDDLDDPVEALVVINGVLNDAVADRVRTALTGELLRSGDPTFPHRLSTLLEIVNDRLEALTGDSSSALEIRFTQLSRQQANLHGLLEQLSEQLDDAAAASTRGFATVLQDLTALGQTGPDAAPRLPDHVGEIFTDATGTLEALLQLDPILTGAFGATGRQSIDDFRALTRAGEFFPAAGTALVLRRIIDGFRSAIETWYGRVETDPPASPDRASAESRAQLDRLCRAYDEVCNQVPAFRLGPLTSVAVRGRAAGSRESSLNYVQDVVENLSPRVRRAVLRSSAPHA
ncbi:ATP-binding protein [Amycolatopsis mediterranei]|uniref:ATP-binding protein n=1 Tax=Amycolatopsis mediterranei TaxID=33910 RepID=UPI001E39D42A|nr:ATP-binding protein [Amycolatopsis mediterranei]UZF74862.1 ATP-binding protein [Amycolatopsis mediterranei]